MDTSHDIDISDQDILNAMKEIPGYLDITPGDFKTLYKQVYLHALERLAHSVKAKDVMTRNVISARRDTPLVELAQKMADQGISGVPVVEEGKKVCGVISEKDFLLHMGGQDTTSFMGVVAQCLRDEGRVDVSMHRHKAEDIMCSPAVSVSEDTSIFDITNLFAEKKINRVPVVDREGVLVGIVARTDIVQSPFHRQIIQNLQKSRSRKKVEKEA